MRYPYHFAVALTWPQFLAILLAIYLLVNIVFATPLLPDSWFRGQCSAHNFGDVFFFSIEASGTVGYGDMYPKTLYGHVIALTEIIGGLGITATVTGLTFVRFSRHV